MDTKDGTAGEIERRILAALPVRTADETPRVDVAIEGSHVVLRGDVHNWDDHATAGRIAAAAPGIHSVDNQLSLFVKGKISTP
ncbi:MAG: BON domain-containing protein [Gemmatimonadaceae bacterium]